MERVWLVTLSQSGSLTKDPGDCVSAVPEERDIAPPLICSSTNHSTDRGPRDRNDS